MLHKVKDYASSDLPPNTSSKGKHQFGKGSHFLWSLSTRIKLKLLLTMQIAYSVLSS